MSIVDETAAAYNIHCSYLVLHMIASPGSCTDVCFAFHILEPIYDACGVEVVGHQGTVFYLDDAGESVHVEHGSSLYDALKMPDRLVSVWLTPMGLPLFNSSVPEFREMKVLEKKIGGIPTPTAIQLFQQCIDDAGVPSGEGTQKSIVWALKVIDHAIVKDIIHIKSSKTPGDLTTLLGKVYGKAVLRRISDRSALGGTYVGSVVERFLHDPWIHERLMIQKKIKDSIVDVPAREIAHVIKLKKMEYESLKDDSRMDNLGLLGMRAYVAELREIYNDMALLLAMKQRYDNSRAHTSNTYRWDGPRERSISSGRYDKRETKQLKRNCEDAFGEKDVEPTCSPVRKKPRLDTSSVLRSGKFAINYRESTVVLRFTRQNERLEMQMKLHNIIRPEACFLVQHEDKLEWALPSIKKTTDRGMPSYSISEASYEEITGRRPATKRSNASGPTVRLVTSPRTRLSLSQNIYGAFGKAVKEVMGYGLATNSRSGHLQNRQPVNQFDKVETHCSPTTNPAQQKEEHNEREHSAHKAIRRHGM